ncbi:MAG: hypothetical protein WBL63_23045 [Candidatus Acidiferrum sp.]
MKDEFGAPKIVGRSTFQAELDALRVREKAHTHVLSVSAWVAVFHFPEVALDFTIFRPILR